MCLVLVSTLAVCACAGANVAHTPAPSTASAVNGETPAASRSSNRVPTQSVESNPFSSARQGPDIPAGGGTFTIPMHLDGGTDWFVTPVGAWDGRILLSRISSVSAAQHADLRETFELWNPATRSAATAWSVPAGQQDWIDGIDGDWVATVRTGLSMPFPVWSLILRNIKTGETRTIASDDIAVRNVPGIRPTLPRGFAPLPSISNGSVVWVETDIDRSTGLPVHRVQLYDLASQTTSTITQDHDARVSDLWSPAISGHYVAWAFVPKSGDPQQVLLRDMSTDATRQIRDPGQVFSLGFTTDGKYLAWTAPGQAYVESLLTGDRVGFAANDGLTFSGHKISWWPQDTGLRSIGGYYDIDTHTVRYVSPPAGTVMAVAGVAGPWFYWLTNDHQSGVAMYHFLATG